MQLYKLKTGYKQILSLSFKHALKKKLIKEINKKNRIDNIFQKFRKLQNIQEY